MLKKEILSNGIRLVGEELPNYNSVSIGIWVSCGSIRENEENNGISHFIEHLLFKGTRNREAREIVGEIEAVGGSIDGFTGREFSGFWVKIPSSYMELAIDVLSDILLHPRFDQHAIEKEKEVVVEEIKGSRDSPQEFLSDAFTRSFWEDSPLGFPILGEERNICSFTREEIVATYRQNYFSQPFIISLAGDFKFTEAKKLILHYFRVIPWSRTNHLPTPPSPRKKILFFPRSLEQVHFIWGSRGVSQRSPLRFAFLVMENILGGGMSSRLFQKVREEKGLVYEVFSFHISTLQAGILAIYGGARGERIKEALSLIMEEVINLREHGVREDEVERSKEFIKGNLVLGLESTQSRMSRLANNEFYYSRLFELDEVLGMIDKVKKKDVDNIARLLIRDEFLNIAFLGREELRESLREEKWRL
ncbi:insulinase family protein [Candidatus Calescamantes bacterium]|nr:insulinase family protein [Candidatus Calescamantes bacterium]